MGGGSRGRSTWVVRVGVDKEVIAPYISKNVVFTLLLLRVVELEKKRRWRMTRRGRRGGRGGGHGFGWI